MDALGLDDRISTSHEADWWRAAHLLTDAVSRWWGQHVEGIVYRSRTTPASSLNVAFFSSAPLVAASVPLADDPDFLDELVVGSGFTVDFPY